jgi:hypothetical protein
VYFFRNDSTMGVLLQLYIKNLLTCCGYCSPVEDRNAYQAVRSIQRSCRYIIQHPLVLHPNNNSSNNNNSNGSNFLNSLFGSNNNNSNNTKGSVRLTKPRRVRLMVQDSDADGQPILSIIPVQNHAAEDSSSTDTTAIAVATTTTIKLRRIDKVQLDGDQIVLYGKTKQPRKNSSGIATGTTTAMSVELLRFSIVLNQQGDDDDSTDIDDGQDTTQSSHSGHNGSNNSDVVLVSTDTRNMMVHYWMVLVEWERQRRLKMKKSSTTTMDDADSDSEETDDIHNGNSTNFITRHAQKIQHYAQREIELQRTKRQREERKAQLLSQTNGGLKYTALAMATIQSQPQQSPSK